MVIADFRSGKYRLDEDPSYYFSNFVVKLNELLRGVVIPQQFSLASLITTNSVNLLEYPEIGLNR